MQSSEINTASLCVTCPSRKSGFCGTLIGSARENERTERNWQQFTAAPAGKQIANRDQIPDLVLVVCNGWAFRYFQLADGGKQILKFLLPGDILSPATFLRKAFDFSVKALTDVRLSGFARSEISARCGLSEDMRVSVAEAFAADAHDATELVTVLGRRSAEERIAYLFLHLIPRIAARTVIREQRYPLPLRHQHIADAVGLTPVHVSRVLSLFRDRGIVTLSDGILAVTNFPELERIGSLK